MQKHQSLVVKSRTPATLFCILYFITHGSSDGSIIIKIEPKRSSFWFYTSPWLMDCQKIFQHTSLLYLATESFALWADHRRWNSSPRKWGLRPWPAGGDWAGQLPTNHRRILRALEELSQPWTDRTLWLPANHSGWNQETQGKNGFSTLSFIFLRFLFFLFFFFQI